jgi:hypothetical protein
MAEEMAERLGCSQNLLRTVQGRIKAEVTASPFLEGIFAK